MKNRLLVIGPFPPPYHGEAIAIKSFTKFLKKYEKIDTNKKTINYHQVFNFSLLFKDVFILIRFMFLLFRIDKVYLSIKRNFFSSIKDVLMINSAFLLKKTIYLHLHSADFLIFYRKQHVLYQSILKKTYLKSKKIFVLSSSIKQQFVGLGFPDELLKIIPNGIQIPFPLKEKIFNTDRPLKIVYFSFINEGKGSDIFIQIAKWAESNKKKWEFGLIGGMSESDSSKWKDQIDSIDCLKYFGEIKNDKIQLLSQFDLMIFPSRLLEGQPLSILEAMMAGLPILASRTGAIPDLITPSVNGFFSENNTVLEYIKIISNLDFNRGLIKLIGENNIEKVKNHYTAEMYINRLKTEMEIS